MGLITAGQESPARSIGPEADQECGVWCGQGDGEGERESLGV